MSAARRQSADPLEFYPTPSETTKAILRRVVAPVALRTERLRVLDPCCGEGAILDAVRDTFDCVSCTGIELDEARAAKAGATHANALEAEWPASDAIVVNPPFSLAMPFVVRAIEDDTAAVRCFLLRLAFLEGQCRAAFHKQYPSDIFVLPKRPSFSADGRSDSSAYAWFVWGLGYGGRWSILGDA